MDGCGSLSRTNFGTDEIIIKFMHILLYASQNYWRYLQMKIKEHYGKDDSIQFPNQ